jgi:transcriptional regulator with XRE-family HTH domain
MGDAASARLSLLGQYLRAHRLRHKITAVSAAEAAGMSRVTFHRIERGEPSVTMGAYLSAIDALGLVLALADPAAAEPSSAGAPVLPARISLADYPQLKQLAWQLPGAKSLTPHEALALYERNWRHVDQAALGAHERELIQLLQDQLAGGRLLV